MVDYLTLPVILFSFVLGEIIALRFRIPPLIVFLLIGALVGTYGFVQQSDTLSFFRGTREHTASFCDRH